MDDESEHIKEVYARFGLALYRAQVLEHGIVNALVVVDLIPSRRHLARSKTEWEVAVDEFMGLHFDHTMGKLMSDLSGHACESVTRSQQSLITRLRNHI